MAVFLPHLYCNLYHHTLHLLHQVLSHYSSRTLDDDMRSQMALDWIARDHEMAGVINQELTLTDFELEKARLAGQELRFYKEKRDILLLARSQTYPTVD